jgi:hypothetical protein
MCSSSKAEKKQTSAADELANQQKLGGQAVNVASQEAKSNIEKVGKTTPEETARLQRYSTKATTPAESLMTEAGPISQAVAQRILERAQNPGMDYDENSSAFAEGVGAPLWASLKSRGIASPAGAEGGGGLGTQQYMKGAAPALAQLRTNQIGTDIAQAENYGLNAQSLQDFYTNLENTLSDVLRNRQVQTVETAAPYGVSGIAAEKQGYIDAAATDQAATQARAAKKDAEATAMGSALMNFFMPMLNVGSTYGAARTGNQNVANSGSQSNLMGLVSSLVSRNPSGAVGSTIQGGSGGQMVNTGNQSVAGQNFNTAWSPYANNTSPTALALQSRAASK